MTGDRVVTIHAIPRITITATTEKMTAARIFAGLDPARSMFRALPPCGVPAPQRHRRGNLPGAAAVGSLPVDQFIS